MRIRTYYRGPDAVVTSEVFIWLTSPAKTFAIRELKNVVIARGDTSRNRVNAAHVAGLAAVGVAVSPKLDGPTMIVAVFLSVAIPGVAVAALYRRTQVWELHAMYRAAAVVIYASSDARVFNQVGRALRRAMEDADPLTRWTGEAA